MKLHVKKGDMVQVIAGDDKGKIAKVLKVYPEKNRAIVEGVNVNKKHLLLLFELLFLLCPVFTGSEKKKGHAHGLE